MTAAVAEDPQLVSALERLGPHDHLCSIYENQQDHFAVAVPFIRIGLERREKCVYIADDGSMNTVRAALAAGGIDLGAAADSGALTIATKDQTYLQRGSFNPEWMFTYWREAADQAVREGFSSLRATGETEWVVRGAPGIERWMEYESRLTHTLADSNAFALCQYNRSLFPAGLVLDVIRTHPVVIYRDTVCRNFYFVPPEEFLNEDQADREVQRLLNNVRDRERLDYELHCAHAELEQRVLDRTRELREREEWLRLAQQSAGLGIADWDIRTDRARFTDELFRIFGLDPSGRTFTYEQWLASVHAEDRAGVREGVAAAFAARRPWEGEFRVVWPDGRVRWIAARATIFFDAHGQPTRVIATHMDITDRKRAEEAHFNAQKLNSIGQLAGGVAHDFNNLLTGILGNASLLLQDAADLNDRRITDIIRSGERAAELTRQLLAYAGKGRLVVEELDLSEVVRGMAALLRLSVPRTVALKFDLAPHLPPIAADHGQMQQIVMSLVTNAAEAIDEAAGGVVRVRTGTGRPGPDCAVTSSPPPGAEPCVYLEVTDTGSGMDEAVKSRIFDPFFSTKFTGRGLGLAAVSGIVRAHGGAIAVHSAPLAGSSFRVYLKAGQLHPAAGISGMVRAGAGTVLVVDDEEPVQAFIAEALRAHGYHVLTAAGSADAVTLFEAREAEIDLVLLDLVLPPLDGVQVLERLRQVRPSARVVIMSGYDEREARRVHGTCAVGGFLQKPFTAERLVAAVRSACAEAVS